MLKTVPACSVALELCSYSDYAGHSIPGLWLCSSLPKWSCHCLKIIAMLGEVILLGTTQLIKIITVKNWTDRTQVQVERNKEGNSKDLDNLRRA